jgi:phenylacetate-CoA ligase
VVSVDFGVRNFAYPISIWRLHAYFEHSQWFTREALLEHQEERLRATIAHAYESVPYYTDLFRKLGLRPRDIRRAGDLRHLTVLSKDMLRTHYDRLTARNNSRYCPFQAQTSGTGGQPVRFLLDKPSNVLEFVYYWRHWSWSGYRLGARFAELATAWFLRHPSFAGRPYIFQRSFGRLLLNSTILTSGRVHEQVNAIRLYRPRFLKGTPSALHGLALFLREHRTTDLSFQAIFSTGETLSPLQRACIETTLHAKVYDSYGHMERTAAVSECPKGRLHINPEYGVLELIPHGKVFQIVGTSLHNKSMPLLRYATGDLAEPDPSAQLCECGRASPRLLQICGRENDVVVTSDGRVLTALFVLLDHVSGVAAAQFVQESSKHLLVKIVKGPDYDSDTFAHKLRRLIGDEMSIAFEYLTYETLREQNRGKFRVVVSKVSSPFAAQPESLRRIEV